MTVHVWLLNIRIYVMGVYYFSKYQGLAIHKVEGMQRTHSSNLKWSAHEYPSNYVLPP